MARSPVKLTPVQRQTPPAGHGGILAAESAAGATVETFAEAVVVPSMTALEPISRPRAMSPVRSVRTNVVMSDASFRVRHPLALPPRELPVSGIVGRERLVLVTALG